jgi:hypothetical protein
MNFFVTRHASPVTKCLGFEIDGRKICFSIFFQWLQSIKSVHYPAAKILNFLIGQKIGM